MKIVFILILFVVYIALVTYVLYINLSEYRIAKKCMTTLTPIYSEPLYCEVINKKIESYLGRDTHSIYHIVELIYRRGCNNYMENTPLILKSQRRKIYKELNLYDQLVIYEKHYMYNNKPIIVYENNDYQDIHRYVVKKIDKSKIIFRLFVIVCTVIITINFIGFLTFLI